MKNTIYIFALLISIQASAQPGFIVTPDGLRDANDTSNSYLMIKADGMTAKQLYDRALKFISAKHSDSITEQIDSTSITYDTYAPRFLVYNNSGAKLDIDAYFTTELQFFDGRFRFEIKNLIMKGSDSKYRLLFKGKFLQAYIVYTNKGKLFKYNTKRDLEYFFNGIVINLSYFVTQ